MAVVADNANGLITEARGELQGISGNARTLLANLNTVTGKPNQKKIQVLLDNVNGMLATERPKIDRLTDQLNALTQHADETVQNVNGTVSDVREPVRKDLAQNCRALCSKPSNCWPTCKCWCGRMITRLMTRSKTCGRPRKTWMS